MRYVSPRLLGTVASISLIVFGAACGGDDKADSKPAIQPATPVAGAANVAPGTPGAPGGNNSVTNSSTQFDKSKATTNPSGLMYIDTRRAAARRRPCSSL